jgi:hypothetical protein
MELIGSMVAGEWLTRGTVWLALTLYTAAEVFGPGRESRVMRTSGCAVFLVHVACAFAFYHHWSHAAAYEDTARQTERLTGWNWGGGLFINYAFALVWMGDVVWVWTVRDRPGWVTGLLRSFFLFMIFNGAVVFVQGAARWYGLALCLVLVNCWWQSGTRRRRSRGQS